MVTGLWVNDYQYRMYDPRTHETRLIFVIAADGGQSEPEEVADVVAEHRERFGADLLATPSHVPMPREQQNEFGPHLNAIAASRERRRETGNRRYF